MGFVETFFETLRTYNETLVLLIPVTFALGIIAALFVIKKTDYSSKGISSILALLWFWSGAVFFILYFGPVDTELLGLTFPGVWCVAGVLFIFKLCPSCFSGWLDVRCLSAFLWTPSPS